MEFDSRLETIDAHVHIMPEYRTAGLVRWIKRAFPDHPSRQDLTAEEIVGEIRAAGCGRAFNFVFPLDDRETAPLNRFAAEVAREHPMLVPFGSMHAATPDKGGVAENSVLELGLAGIKLHPYAQRFEVFCDEFEPLFAKMNDLGAPLFVHTGFDAFYGRTLDLGRLERTLEEYPGMPLVLVHCLFPRFELAHRLVESYPGLYLDLTNVPGTLRLYDHFPGDVSTFDPDFYDGPRLVESLRALVEEHSDRMMYGTDHPVGMGSPARVYEDLDRLGFSGRAVSDLKSASAARFLGLHCRAGSTPNR